MLLAALLVAHAQKPDVVVIVPDDLGWSEVPLMPSVQALASQAVTFTRAYVLPTCSPSRYALECGRYPRRQETVAVIGQLFVHQPNGIGDLSFNAHVGTQDRIPLDARFLPQALKPEYDTTLIGKWHLGRLPLLGQMDQIPSGPFARFDRWLAGSTVTPGAGPNATGHYKWNRVENGEMQISTVYTTDAQRDAFLSYWAEPHDDPRFVVLAWSAPHSPFNPPPGTVTTGTARGDYELAVRYLDRALGDVLAAIDLATTYVFFLPDNGTPDAAAPVPGYSGFWKGSCYEGGIRVPLFVAGPGILPGTTSRLVQVEDLAATISELSGTPLGSGFEDSVSFADSLGAWTGAPARRFVFAERYEVPSSPEYPQPAGYDALTIAESRYKLIRSDEDGSGPGGVWERLYDLATDPYEQVPLHPTMPGIPRHVATFLRTQLSRLEAEAASLPPRAP